MIASLKKHKKIIAFYKMSADALPKIMTCFPAHRARLGTFHAHGAVLAAGPIGNPPHGAMAIFTKCEPAEEFIAGDPFVVNR